MHSCQLFLFILTLFVGCSLKPITFHYLPMVSYVDSSTNSENRLYYKFDRYVVSGYKDTKKARLLIDSFVQQVRDPQFARYQQYEIWFYKESKYTNVKSLQDNIKVFHDHSDQDRIYQYMWLKGQALPTWKIIDGEVVEPPNNVIISEIPDSSKKEK